MNRSFSLNLSALLVLGIALTGCASIKKEPEPLEFAKQDPYENANRSVFKFNEMLDNNVMEPVARGYKVVVPGPIRSMFTNIRSNFDDIGVTVNSRLSLVPWGIELVCLFVP